MSSSRAKIALTIAAAALLAACHPKTSHGQDAASAEPDAAGKAFLAKMAKTEGVHVLPSGLEYKIVSSGPAGAPTAKEGDEVKVQYQGTLIDGTVFDSTYQNGEPAVFTVGEVVPGWNEALEHMRPGDVWYLYIPPKLGYGAEGKGPIPPGAVMVFKIELLGVLPHGGAMGQG